MMNERKTRLLFFCCSAVSSATSAPSVVRCCLPLFCVLCGESQFLSLTRLSFGSHRQLDPLLLRRLDCDLVARVRMTRDANAGIVRQHPLETYAHLRRPVGHDHLTRMQRVSDAHATTVMERHPRGTTRGVEQRIQNRPIGDGVRAIPHRFRFPKWRRDAPRIEMIATD